MWSKKFVGYKKYFGQKEFGRKKVVYKNQGSQKIEYKKFGQNRASKSWDIADMNKCHHYSWHLLKIVPGTYL